MVEIRELLEYNDETRRKYLESFARLPWSEFVKDRGASWGSIRNIFIHTLGAIDYWLDFMQKENLHSRRKHDEYRTFEEVKTYMEHVEKRMRNYLDTLPEGGLKKKYVVKNNSDETVEITVEDVLIHIFEEEVHHRGEIIALLWQMNIEPPLMGWKNL
jgi:uncharacterized damage-inducible protein DinB